MPAAQEGRLPTWPLATTLSLVLVGEGYTNHVFIDDNRRPAPLPGHYLEVFDSLGDEKTPG